MAYYNAKGEPWRYKGAVDVSDCTTSAEVIEKAGLDWYVDKCELYAKMQVNIENDYDLDKVIQETKDKDAHLHGKDIFRNCPNAFATYRTDYNIPLGVVKGKYTPVQNKEAFTFFDDAIGSGKAIWQTAGSFGSGERIFVSAKLPNNILVKGDPVDNYLVFTNTHDGSSGVKILFTPIRVICRNTLTAAIRTSTNYVSFRHTASVHSNIQLAHEILGICDVRRKEIEQVYNMLAEIKVTDEDVMEFIGKNVLSPNEEEVLFETGHSYKELCYRNNTAYEDSGISMRKLNVLSATWDYYNRGVGQKEIMGTAWGAVNAITGYYSNVDNAKDEKRFDSLVFGDKSRKIQTAFAMAEEFN